MYFMGSLMYFMGRIQWIKQCALTPNKNLMKKFVAHQIFYVVNQTWLFFQAEKLFKQALKASEALLRNSASVNPDTKEEALHSEWQANHLTKTWN